MRVIACNLFFDRYFLERGLLYEWVLVAALTILRLAVRLQESAKYLANSPYIRNLALLVIAYGMSINIVEVSLVVSCNGW